MAMNLHPLLLLSAIFLFSCVKDDSDTPQPEQGKAFYPTVVGSYIDYRADSIFHDQPDPTIPGTHDTTTYYIRELIESEFIDAADEPALRLERFKKNEESDPWELRDVWFLKRTNRNVQKVEENIRYIKMGFPVASETTWNGNALNELDAWTYRFDSLYVPRTYADQDFTRTVRVLQRENKNFVEDELAYEIYGENIGLIYRYYRDLDTQLNYTNNPIAANIRQGVEFHWEIIAYGNE